MVVVVMMMNLKYIYFQDGGLKEQFFIHSTKKSDMILCSAETAPLWKVWKLNV
jgi:hypothetical protein